MPVAPELQITAVTSNSGGMPTGQWNVSSVPAATSGSAELDLPASEDVVLIVAVGIQAVPTGMWTPIPRHSGISLQGR